MSNNIDIYYEREQNKIGLENYVLDKTNVYDIAIDKLIDELKESIKTSKKEIDDLSLPQKESNVSNIVLEEQSEDYVLDKDYQKYLTILDIIYNEEQLLSLVEMKIIYAFKSLEINIKKLLKAAFSLKSTNDFYKWENLVTFLKDKNINIKTEFKSYEEITQLKLVNNDIKHGEHCKKSLNSIKEFKGADDFTYYNLDNFYKRIKKIPTTFLEELVTAIYNELYVFDENKIEKIANSFAVRMNEEDAKKLTQKINEKYD